MELDMQQSRMMVLIVATVAALGAVAGCASMGNSSSSSNAGLQYPSTRVVDHVDTYHGTRVADPYRWLEDDNSADTKAWVTAQNAVTEKHLSAMPQRLPTRKMFTNLYNFEKFGLPYKEGGRYFWWRNDGLQQQNVIYTATALDAAPTVALDPNSLSKDGTVALTGTVPAKDGKLLAYGVAEGGSDWQTWRVRDLASGKDLPDVLRWVKFSTAVWTPDHQGFFYARYDAPQPGAALTGANYFQKLYYHRLGTEQSADVVVAQNPTEKAWGFSPDVSEDGKWLVITVWKDTGRRNGLMVMPLASPANLSNGAFAPGKTQNLTMAFDAEYTVIGFDGDKLLLKTDKDAQRGRIIGIDLKDPASFTSTANWKTLVAEAPDAMVGASAVGGRLVLRYLRDASTQVRVHGIDGALQREVALPGVGTAGGFGGRMASTETFFSYTSLINPSEIWRYDVATGATSLFKRPQTAFDAAQFETRREFVTSKDGTRLPIFIAHRKGLKLDGNNPTLLYGYGGFNASQTPSYGVTAATWMQMGGVYVSASLRGGGEYGAAWHEAGTKLKKQNTFDDFIASAEWLINNKITSPKMLAVQGGSNGGLLVGAVVNQRPDLFGAALPAVGVMDMLRFQKFTIGWAWVSDYGSSDDAEQFKALKAYSPLHNINVGKSYPAVLVTTADHDDRVVPAHSFKYAAALQAASTGKAPKLIRIETQAGHGAGKPTSKLIEERADMLAFVANAFGVEVR
jgi:prolyl oligopeptidase